MSQIKTVKVTGRIILEVEYEVRADEYNISVPDADNDDEVNEFLVEAGTNENKFVRDSIKRALPDFQIIDLDLNLEI